MSDTDDSSEPRNLKATTVERRSEREVVVTRWFDAPVPFVFRAWSEPELFRRWRVPKSMGMTLCGCDMDVRVGGEYRLDFGGGAQFVGRYIDVTPPFHIAWTNEEAGSGGSVTTVTLEEDEGGTLLVMSDLYPSKDALDVAGTGPADAMRETFRQLDELLTTLS